MTLLTDLQFELKELYRFRWLTVSMVRSTLRTRYKRSILGFFWSLLGPILNYLVMGIIFSYMMSSVIENYSVYLFAGIAIFNLLSVNLNCSPGIMISNENYIKRIYLPKAIFVLNSVLLEYVNFIFSFVALLILGVAFRKLQLSAAYVSLIIPLVCALLFNFGLSAMVSIATVFFRDIAHVLPIIMQAVFFATPVMYSAKILPPEIQELLPYNPFLYFVEAFRYPIYKGEFPPWNNILILLASSLSVFLFGFSLLKKFENKIVFRL
jgi:ABC-type polysaccharide/polyol phosphate export permease